MKVLTAYKEFTDQRLLLRNYSSNTVLNYNCAIKSFLDTVGNIDIGRINVYHFLRWKQGTEDRLHINTQIRYRTHFRNFLRFTNKKGYTNFDLEDLPIDHEQKTLPRYHSEDEILRLIANTKDLRTKTIISVMYSTGARICELDGIKRTDRVGKDCLRVLGKGKKERNVYLSQSARELLDAYLMTHDSCYMFPGYNGSGLVGHRFSTLVRAEGRRQGITTTAHALRHSHATNLLRKTNNLRVVQESLGHVNIKTTQVYTHIEQGELQSAHHKAFD